VRRSVAPGPSICTNDRELIAYCTIGGRACTAWFVLAYLLGREHVASDGSWAEWGPTSETPLESREIMQ
jgi:thiosulfate/3-mercaptopyruvate sulfurtransferase